MSIDNDVQARIDAYALNELKFERDKLIAATDWWAGSDHTMTDAQTAYRQALRDLPTQYSADKKTKQGYLDWSKITLPTKPEA
jgi:hypothetical protein|tara:strand:- start:10 stop:258 length:249 start_codon:yes stop_codon:yes gene_type:complete